MRRLQCTSTVVFFAAVVLFAAAVFAHSAGAVEIATGATRAEVVAALGEPEANLRAGDREVLTFAEKRVTLERGRVVRCESIEPESPLPARPAAAKAKSDAAPKSASKATGSAAGWQLDFDAAQALAKRDGKRLLVLFTGSDWCPPCMRFEREAANDPAFLSAVQKDFVLVKLDFPRSTPQAPEIRARNERLQRQYEITGYPTLMTMTADGKKPAKIDLGRAWSAPRFANGVIEQVTGARSAGGGGVRLPLIALGLGIAAFVGWLIKR